MRSFISGTKINLVVTIGVAVLVVLMPLIDSLICRRLGVNLYKGLSTNPHALRLRKIRQGILVTLFAIYIAAVAWLVFFSRSAMENYAINSVIMKSLRTTIYYDTGILGAIWNFLRGVLSRDMSGVNMRAFEDLSQVYLNVMLFVPLGYLLPYVFHYFRTGSRHRRTVVLGFVCSLLIENLQLISKRGLYDVDDLVANTLGALIGCLLFSNFAYFVTHPHWRKQLKLRRKWNHVARKSAMLPLAKHMHVSRATLIAKDREQVVDFYIRKLGFRPMAHERDAEGNTVSILLQLGGARLEVIIDPNKDPGPQVVTLYAGDIDTVKDRLEKCGLTIKRTFVDRYEHRGCVEIEGPNQERIVWIS